MIGAKDLAFPKINLLSWYVYVVGAAFTLYSIVAGGLDTGWTFYTLEHCIFEFRRDSRCHRHFHHRILLDSHWSEFSVT
jgi:hypothetical protein